MKNYVDTFKNAYTQSRIDHWNKIAAMREKWRGAGSGYHHRLSEIYRFLIHPGARVLEIGCAEGDLLASLEPALGVGVDFSGKMLDRAQEKHPELDIRRMDADDLSPLEGEYDYIILSDLVNDLWDVQLVFEQVRKISAPHTRVVINSYSRLWEIPLKFAQALRLATPMLTQNWLTPDDIAGLLNLAGFQVFRSWQEVLFPFRIPFIESFFNRFLVRLWPFRQFALANFSLARIQRKQQMEEPTVSVIVPARNEAGNIKEIFERVPAMGKKTELVFVEGHSQDDTLETIKQEIEAHPSVPSMVLQQTGVGKGDAMRLGYSRANGDIFMILDADLTVPPEDLPRFYDALCSGKGDFINGVRLVYPMEDQAMRFLNFLGNKAFSLTFSWLLGQPIKDTLCGTKVLWKSDYLRIAANRSYFGDFDPFGDFDLIFGAAKQNLRIVDLPIRYRERKYGSTNISRWKHGFLLLRMVWFAARRIKFV